MGEGGEKVEKDGENYRKKRRRSQEEEGTIGVWGRSRKGNLQRLWKQTEMHLGDTVTSGVVKRKWSEDREREEEKHEEGA